VLGRAALDARRRSGDLADALRPLRALDALDRILVAQSFLLGEPSSDDLRAALRQRGVDASGAEIDQALDRLMLGYLLLRDGDSGRLVCPVPWVREAVERERKLEDRLLDDLDEWARKRAGRSAS
jgi:hypothetical protein